MRKYLLISAVIAISLLSGCASVPMEKSNYTDLAKQFNNPSEGKAGIYIYRADSHAGAAIKKDVWINDECIGETAKGIFFYHEVEGNKEHKLSTESLLTPNDLTLYTEVSKLYFIKQNMTITGVGMRATLEQKTEQEGKVALSNLQMATKGKCGSPK